MESDAPIEVPDISDSTETSHQSQHHSSRGFVGDTVGMISKTVQFVNPVTIPKRLNDEINRLRLGPACLTEFIGTFMLVFTIAMTVGLASTSITISAGSATWDPLAIGSILMCMIFMGGHVSGAHYNPAVSLAVSLRGKLAKGHMPLYWLFQCFGATAGALLCYMATGFHPYPHAGTGYTQAEAFICELVFSCILSLVVLNVATTKATENNSFFGLAIGFTVTAGAYSVGPISGAVFNPAVGTGLLLVNMFAGGAMNDIWLYWFAPCLGAVFAALFYRLMNPKEYETENIQAQEMR
jgi:aquaporin Z